MGVSCLEYHVLNNIYKYIYNYINIYNIMHININNIYIMYIFSRFKRPVPVDLEVSLVCELKKCIQRLLSSVEKPCITV